MVPFLLLNTSPDPIVLYKGTSVSHFHPQPDEEKSSPVCFFLTSQTKHRQGIVLFDLTQAKCSKVTRVETMALLHEFADIVAQDDSEYGRTNLTYHRIETGFAIPSLFYRGEKGDGGGGFDLEKIEQMLKDSPVIEIGTVPPPYLGQPVILPRVKRSSTTSRGTFLREQEYTIANLPQPF
uniref:Uncharacterized protein n=1 Tax=Timema tahoe TaxID=61484 RepID=A0A7R9INV7_9NEOP|nr:unnamed protein product [Timema tahoe]